MKLDRLTVFSKWLLFRRHPNLRFSQVITSIVLAARPKTLPAAIVPVWCGSVLAWRLAGSFDLKLALCTLFGALAIQVATNFFNDAIDHQKGADTDKRLGPKRVTSSGLMTSRAVLLWGGLFVAVAFGFGVVLYQSRGWPILAIGIPSLFLTYGYTGGPFPLAYRGMGELFVIMFFGLVAVSGTAFIQTGSWSLESLVLGGQVGLLSSVLISINNLRDREEDAGTRKKTLAVRLGAKWAAYVVGLEMALVVVLGCLWLGLGHAAFSFACLPVFVLGPVIMRALLKGASGPECNRLLALGGMQLLAFGVAFHLASLLKLS